MLDPFANQIVTYLDPVSATMTHELDANIAKIFIGDMLWNLGDIKGGSYENTNANI